MPVYEYEHIWDDCELCDYRFGVVQAVDEAPLEFCPSCGLNVRRVVSQISVVKSYTFDADKAAKKGFTTWKKSGIGTWEKIAGSGVDMIVGDPDSVKE
ncbi:MAG: zinc ribbon domain-containing protein [Chthonomonadaceae bacterium]|nr:zinc ribbon domain-containing protein [Chthonomonadaceae bacterium]